ncbi:hypothetical protein F2P79_012829 [Pimephales promelas]|nr:hypothetical protein F2P79_012829 [Pimephales promelas]
MQVLLEWDHKSVVLLFRVQILHNEPVTSDFSWRSADSPFWTVETGVQLWAITCIHQRLCPASCMMNELKGNSSLPAPERESERKKETEKRHSTVFFWVNQLLTPSPPPPFHASLPPPCVTGSPHRNAPTEAERQAYPLSGSLRRDRLFVFLRSGPKTFWGELYLSLPPARGSFLMSPKNGGKYKMRGVKKMTAYKGAINNSQKQGCPDTEKIGKILTPLQPMSPSRSVAIGPAVPEAGFEVCCCLGQALPL